MPRRTAITSSTPAAAPSAAKSPSPAASNTQSALRASPSQPFVHHALARGIVNDEIPTPSFQGSNPHDCVVPKKPVAQAAKKKIVRPPQYHETHRFLDKERTVQPQLDIPWHLGHRVGECYRLATTMNRVIEQAALHVRPISWGYGTKDGTLGHDNTEHHVDVMKRIAVFRRDHLRQVSAGDKLSLFLTSAGRVMICGRLFLHQDGTIMWKPRDVSFANARTEDDAKDPPPSVDDVVRIVSVEAGHLAAYAIDVQGRVFAWGTKRYGQLGRDDDDEAQESDTKENTSTQEPTPEHGDSDTNAADEDKVVEKPLSRHDPVETTPPLVASEVLASVRVLKVSAGNHFVLALSSCGKAFSWGLNTHGQLGLGETVSRESVNSPQQIQSTLESAIVVDIAAGHSHSLVVALPRTSPGEIQTVYASYSMVFVFGRGQYGCLGIGGDQDQLTPMEVAYFRGLHATSVAAGHDHSLVLCAMGLSNYVYAFGGNQFGQLGIAQHGMSFSDMPMAIDELSGRTITSIGAGAYVSSALCGDGELYTWGDGTHGKTARPDKRTIFVPWKIPSQADAATSRDSKAMNNHRVVLDGDGFVTQLSMGAHHSLALYRTEGKPDRWRKVPMGPIASALDIREGRETLSDTIVCESSLTRSPVAVLGIALYCEPCAVGPLCRVCVRRCHRGHRLVPRSMADNPPDSGVACVCGSRRPPPTPHQLPPTRSRPSKPMDTGSAVAQETLLTEDAGRAYCSMVSVPSTIPEETELRF